MWVLSGHYQGTRNFTFESLDSARARRLHWRNRIALLYQGLGPNEGCDFNAVMDAVNNNLGSPEAFALIDGSELSMKDWQKVDELFGLDLLADSQDIDDEVREMISARQTARLKKNWAESDRLRDLLAERGITVKDTADGPVWEYLR